MSQHGKPISEIGFDHDALTDRLRNSLSCGGDDDDANKPDFRELDLGSPVSTLRTRHAGTAGSGLTTTSSSSSSSGSVSGRSGLNPVSKRSDSNHSGELSGSVENSPTARGYKPAQRSSDSGGTHPLIYSGGSVNSPPPNVLPTGNICPSGKILKTGMATRTAKSDVLGLGTGHYGHGSIMRGGAAPKSCGGSDAVVGSAVANSRGSPTGEAPRRRSAYANDPEELKRAGNEQYRKGNLADALRLYDQAIAMSPGNPAYHFNRSAALMGLRRTAEAASECEKAIRLDPGYVRAHHRLGSLLLSLGQVESARKHICFPGYHPDPVELQKLQAIEKHIKKCTDSRKVGDWKSAIREIDAAISSGADSSPPLFACRAEAYLKLHKLEEADLTLSNALKFRSTAISSSEMKFFGMFADVYLFFVQAQVEMALGRFDNAMMAIEKAVQNDPENIEISVFSDKVRLVGRARARGNDLFQSERFTEACGAYSEGLRVDPSNSVLFCNRAACCYKLGRWEGSIDDCNEALRIRPNYTKALLRRAASNAKLERWGEAVRDYDLLRKEHPFDKDVAESLFHAQISLKKSIGEEVYNMKFGGEVELVSSLDQFRAAISSPGASVVHFEAASNIQSKQISPFFDTLCSKYPSINFLKVDVEESVEIAVAENVKIVPTFKIYKNGSRMKEMVCPIPQVLESSVRHYDF